jgi:hypothetical protein
VDAVIKNLAISTLAQHYSKNAVYGDGGDVQEFLWEVDASGNQQLITGDDLFDYLEGNFTRLFMNQRETEIRRTAELIGLENMPPDDREFIKRINEGFAGKKSE